MFLFLLIVYTPTLISKLVKDIVSISLKGKKKFKLIFTYDLK